MARWVKKSGQKLTGWFEPDVAEADGIEVILNEDVVVMKDDVWAISSLREISEDTEEQREKEQVSHVV